MSGNRNAVEIQGCLVCAKIFNILAVYTPDGKLVDCTVTSPGGHIVPDEQNPLVVCDSHSAEEIASAYKIWQSNRENETSSQDEE